VTSTATSVARRYFDALGAHDLDAALACWKPGSVDRLVGQQELTAPDGIREYFSELFEAFPDFKLEVIDEVAGGDKTAVRWRASGTFAGPGTFQGFAPNGRQIAIEGCDVVTVSSEPGGELIVRNDAYIDTGDLARQLGMLPPAGSPAEARLTKVANLRTRAQNWFRGTGPEPIADGVWVVRGGFPSKSMNVYFIADEGGVTMFDAGISDMTSAVRTAGVQLGGIKRVVLGHADADHRGSAPGIDAPVYCHPADREAAESSEPLRPYWDFSKLKPYGRALYKRLLPAWDGGAVQIAGTVQEGDEIAGFRVIELPGHAPGLIGLFRDSDRLALVSDCFYTVDPQTGIKGAPRVPIAAFTMDTEQARASIRKLAAMSPSVAWAGHADPVRGDVVAQLEHAASAT
jgi:glyoxylase-like metal-dependent hydrolase (beta-lactamase superfamily II)/predicted ester cyclase